MAKVSFCKTAIIFKHPEVSSLYKQFRRTHLNIEFLNYSCNQ